MQLQIIFGVSLWESEHETTAASCPLEVHYVRTCTRSVVHWPGPWQGLKPCKNILRGARHSETPQPQLMWLLRCVHNPMCGIYVVYTWEFILFLCKSEVWTSITWQWKWNTTLKVLVSPRHILLYICTEFHVPTPSSLPERRSVLNYIIFTS